MCRKYSKVYTCGHTKAVERGCPYPDRSRLLDALFCPRGPTVIIGQFHYDCHECTARDVELWWTWATGPPPVPIVRKDPERISAQEDGRPTPEGKDAMLAKPGVGKSEVNALCAPSSEGDSVNDDLRRGPPVDVRHQQRSQKRQRSPEPAEALPQGKSLKQSPGLMNLIEKTSQGCSGGRTRPSRRERLSSEVGRTSRPPTDREQLPSYKNTRNHSASPPTGPQPSTTRPILNNVPSTVAEGQEKRSRQAPKDEGRPPKSQRLTHRNVFDGTACLPVIQESHSGEEAAVGTTRSRSINTAAARLELRGTYDPSAVPAPLQVPTPKKKRKMPRRAKPLDKMEMIPEVGSPVFTDAHVAGCHFGGNRPAADFNGSKSIILDCGSVREAVSVRPGAGKSRVKVCGDEERILEGP